MTYFRVNLITLSLAQNVFTAEFGMDSGGSRSLLSPGKAVYHFFYFYFSGFFILFVSMVIDSSGSILFSRFYNPLGL